MWLWSSRGERYQRAVDAHRNGHTLRTTGTLTREGRGLVLKDPTTPVVEQE